jgi:mRNA-degrading endonuclease YafQ of YafQ-DinJ toxin-antitoxin module
MEKALQRMSQNPFMSNLKTHWVTAKYDSRPALSCFVTGDLRIIWRFEKKEIHLINLIDIGGHSGRRKVYK